ncbi:MAG: DegQ family serine endoprotease [Chthoniobacteraceae bacterium]
MNNTTRSHSTWRVPRLIFAGAFLAASVFAVTQAVENREGLKKPAVIVDARPLNAEMKAATSFAPVIKRVSPSVVKVVSSTRVQNTGLDEFSDNPFFRRFFGEEGAAPRRPSPPRESGLGSGVIVTADGYVLTNNHVIDRATGLKVALHDGREFSAKVIGTDPKTDLAVIKIDATGLPAIQMTDSEQVEVGDAVLAIGNPFGIGQTVTTGIVSAMGRSAIGLDYEDFIQTDAAINPGNSGGALVDVEGRLVGINTAILSRSGGNQGIGFAIPSTLAREVMESLITDGKVTRGYLGVMIQDLNPTLAKKFNAAGATGALVGDVTPRSPAESAGLASGDVVTEFDGKPVTDSRHLKLQVARVKPGQSVEVKLLRDGKPKTLAVKVGELPNSDKLAKAGSDSKTGDTGTLNGVGVGALDAHTRRELNIPAEINGAVITSVDRDSAAAQSGLMAGDVILEINREKVTSPEDAVRLTGRATDKTTLVKVWSRGGQRYLVVDENKVG